MSQPFPYAGRHEDSELYDFEGQQHPKAIQVFCPGCRVSLYPFLNKSLTKISRYPEWVRQEYQQWYTRWQCKCTQCNLKYDFETYTLG